MAWRTGHFLQPRLELKGIEQIMLRNQQMRTKTKRTLPCSSSNFISSFNQSKIAFYNHQKITSIILLPYSSHSSHLPAYSIVLTQPVSCPPTTRDNFINKQCQLNHQNNKIIDQFICEQTICIPCDHDYASELLTKQVHPSSATSM